MKIIKILFLYLLVLYYVFAETEENMIKNGSFEDGLNYWKISVPEYIKVELDAQEKKTRSFL